MGPLDVSQGTLLIASLIVIIPAVMIVVSLLLSAGTNRSLNLALAIIYTLINISNLIGESWAYYLLFGVIEIDLLLRSSFSPLGGGRMTWRSSDHPRRHQPSL